MGNFECCEAPASARLLVENWLLQEETYGEGPRGEKLVARLKCILAALPTAPAQPTAASTQPGGVREAIEDELETGNVRVATTFYGEVGNDPFAQGNFIPDVWKKALRWALQQIDAEATAHALAESDWKRKLGERIERDGEAIASLLTLVRRGTKEWFAASEARSDLRSLSNELRGIGEPKEGEDGS